MMFAGFYKNFCCFGTDRKQYKIENCSKDKFLSDVYVNFDLSMSDIQRISNDRLIFTTYRSAKSWLTGSGNCQKATLSKEIFKKFQIDINNDEKIIAFCFFQMIIDFYIEKVKKELRNMNTKLNKIRRLMELEEEQKRISNLIEKEQENCFNFNNFDIHSAVDFSKAKKIKKTIPLSDAKKYGFEQILENSRFYMNENKKLFMKVGDYLIALNSNDYIIEGEQKNGL